MHSKYPKSYPRDDVWGLLALAHFQDLKKVSKLTPKEKVELIKKEQCRNLKEAWGSKGKMCKIFEDNNSYDHESNTILNASNLTSSQKN